MVMLKDHKTTHVIHALRHDVYKFIAWNYTSPSLPPNALNPMRAWRMLTSRSGLFKSNGALIGTGYNNQKFGIIDVTAKEIERTTVQEGTTFMNPGFQGVMVSLPHHMSFLGRTVIATDKGAFNPTTIDMMKRVGFASSEFEEIFEVYSDDQVEARALITPDFMERLIRFSREVLGHRIQCSFLGNQIHIALDIDQSFQFSHDLMSPGFEKAKNIVIAEAGTVCVLLEKLQALQSTVGREGSAGADKARKAHYLAQLELLASRIKSLKPDGDWSFGMPAGMEDNHHMFCDSLKGLLYPRV